MLPMVVASRHKSRAEETNQSIKQLETMNEAQVTFYFEPSYTIGAKKHVATIRSVADLINHNLYQRMLTGDVKIYDVEMNPFKSKGCHFKESINNLIKVISWYTARPKPTYNINEHNN